MTFSDLQNLVAYNLDDLNFGYFTTTQVKVWLNNAQREVQKRLVKAGQNYYTKCVQTSLVVGQNEYVLPSDFKKEHRLEVVISGSFPNESINPILPITRNQTDLISNGTGVPQFYYFRKNRVVIWPSPDSTYTMRLEYTYLVTDMVNDTDVPDVPDSYHELIALLAAQDGFIKDGRASELLVKKIADYQRDFDTDAQERNQDMSRSIRETGSDNASGFYF